MDKNFLISKLAIAADQSKGDNGRNQYLLKRIRTTIEISLIQINYILNEILGLKISEITDETQNKDQQILKKDKSVFLNPNLIKCVECTKEIKLDEKSTRIQSLWYHDTCQNSFLRTCRNLKKESFKIIKIL